MAGRNPLLLAHKSEQEVLRAEVVLAERPRLVLSQDNHLLGMLGKPLEHRPERTARTHRFMAGRARLGQCSETPERPVGGRAYLTATTSTARISGSAAKRSSATWPSAVGISPSRCVCRSSAVSNVSKMP